jgi:hypothetical protein
MGSPSEYFEHVREIVIHFECGKCGRHGECDVELEASRQAKKVLS